MMIVEPHADDAFLSMHAHIVAAVKAGTPVTIATIFADERRAAESQAYARAVGANHLWYGYSEGDALDPSTFSADSIVLGPLGIEHPDHLAVRRWIGDSRDILFYVDIPYYTKQKNGTELQSKIAGYTVSSVIVPHASKGRFSHFFKSQAKFFYFNPPESFIKTPEILISKKPITLCQTAQE